MLSNQFLLACDDLGSPSIITYCILFHALGMTSFNSSTMDINGEKIKPGYHFDQSFQERPNTPDPRKREREYKNDVKIQVRKNADPVIVC